MKKRRKKLQKFARRKIKHLEVSGGHNWALVGLNKKKKVFSIFRSQICAFILPDYECWFDTFPSDFQHV